MLRVLLTVAAIGLVIYALMDCVQTTQDRILHLPKLAWIVVIIVVPWVGPAAWILAGTRRTLPPGNRPRTGPRGPEDDPDFLRNL